MTSTTDTAGHPEVTELSDLVEGLLPPSRSADVRRHLDECPLCTDVHDSIEEIRNMLGTLPGPPHMPADVAGRIDAALAAEALLNATVPSADTTTPAPVGVSRFTRDETDGVDVSRETSPVVGRPAGRSGAATGPGRTDSKRRTRRRTAVLGTVLAVATLGLGTAIVQSMGGESSGGPAVARTEGPPEHTFSGKPLKNQVTDLLAGNDRMESLGTGPKPGTPGSATEGPTLLRTAKVPDCIREGIGRDTAPLAVREGSYQGAQAYLIVLPGTPGTDRVMAYVVDASCVNEQEKGPGDVLAQQSYAHPAASPSTRP